MSLSVPVGQDASCRAVLRCAVDAVVVAAAFRARRGRTEGVVARTRPDAGLIPVGLKMRARRDQWLAERRTGASIRCMQHPRSAEGTRIGSVRLVGLVGAVVCSIFLAGDAEGRRRRRRGMVISTMMLV